MPSEISTETVLIAEDEPKLSDLLREYMQNAGFKTHCVFSGTEVIPAFKKVGPTIILLDLMLPGKQGTDICTEIRQFSDVPIIMITARVDEIDRLLGLEVGADDYICKPFSPREVVARVKTILRRVAPRESDAKDEAFAVNVEKMQISYQNAVLDLTQSEFDILSMFVKNPGRVYSRNALLDHISTEDRDVSDRAIDSHIKNLRRKLSVFEKDEPFIRSIYGVGYKFES
ncbi:response regulator [Gammaproteobacteria bacterium]|nr:response regulator [Gammaproteobacteria bacterium]